MCLDQVRQDGQLDHEEPDDGQGLGELRGLMSEDDVISTTGVLECGLAYLWYSEEM